MLGGFTNKTFILVQQKIISYLKTAGQKQIVAV